jgi:hypothetical protein
MSTHRNNGSNIRWGIRLNDDMMNSCRKKSCPEQKILAEPKWQKPSLQEIKLSPELLPY